jgi:peptide/nickel transport system substrate-binding protein
MARGGKMMKTKGIIVCLTAMMFLLTGMYLMVPTAAGVTRINTSIAGDLVNIDPAHLSIGPDRMIAHQVLEGLVEFDCGTSPCKPLPRLAESHKISADAKMITFKLRKGVKFHGGYGEFTSEDVAFNLRRHMDPKTASRGKAQVADIEKMIETPDKYTVVIHLKIPSAFSLLRNLAWQNIGKMVSKKAVKGYPQEI